MSPRLCRRRRPVPVCRRRRSRAAASGAWRSRSFDVLPGVLATTSGYAGPRGSKPDPTYHEVGAGGTGYREAVQVLFDPNAVSYERLLDVYWHQIDPSFPDRMFLDAGEQYSSAIFPNDEAQAKEAGPSENVRRRTSSRTKWRRKYSTPGRAFFPAEKYHQDYYKKNAARYGVYRAQRERRVRAERVGGGQQRERAPRTRSAPSKSSP